MEAPNNFTDEEILQVSCLFCGAEPGKKCNEGEGTVLIGGYHQARIELRQKLPVMPADMPVLDATDKAIIVYYAFVALCNSCQTKSTELFGKQFSSREIQYAFATQGLKAAREDGLIGGPKMNRKQRRAAAAKKSTIIM